MAPDILLTAVNILSALATAALVVMTTKPCRSSSAPYLLGIPAGLALIAVSFTIQAFQTFLISGSPLLGLPLAAASLLTQTYGILFVAFAYARRTRFRLIGESTSAPLLTAVVVTLIFLVVVFATGTVGTINVPAHDELFLRMVVTAATAYLVYETLRNWTLTRRASEGFVTIGFAFFLAEQVGFMLVIGNLGPVATFLAYEGRILGLLVLNTALIVGVKRGDLVTVLKRLGLGAPVHIRATPLPLHK